MALLITLSKDIIIPIPNDDNSSTIEDLSKSNPVSINGECFQLNTESFMKLVDKIG